MNNLRVKTYHNTSSVKGKYVLYWMQHTQRIEYNYALYEAIKEANQSALPLKVLFVVNPDYKDANQRHFAFMLEGIMALIEPFKKMGVGFHIEVGSFDETVTSYINDAASLFMDDAYLKPLKTIKDQIIKTVKKPVYQVFSDVIVPVYAVSEKAEYSARTIRPKLLKMVDGFLDDVTHPELDNKQAISPTIKIQTLLEHVDDTVLKSDYFKGGREAGLDRLELFLKTKLKHYPDSNDPSLGLTSTLSPYLHFGQLSPVEIYLAVDAYKDTYLEACEGFLEQLLIRRELAFNFVYYLDGYDQFGTMTYGWAYDTMKAHADDKRNYIYSIDDYKKCDTHDEYFNAAMCEMVKTGYMHNYMRMYWGKKIIEWSDDYQSAYETILTLNNMYFIDGRDPVSYASVAWLFGRHDRAWVSRDIFGKLRYMNANGLKRKFDIDTYVEWTKKL